MLPTGCPTIPTPTPTRPRPLSVSVSFLLLTCHHTARPSKSHAVYKTKKPQPAGVGTLVALRTLRGFCFFSVLFRFVIHLPFFLPRGYELFFYNYFQSLQKKCVGKHWICFICLKKEKWKSCYEEPFYLTSAWIMSLFCIDHVFFISKVWRKTAFKVWGQEHIMVPPIHTKRARWFCVLKFQNQCL